MSETNNFDESGSDDDQQNAMATLKKKIAEEEQKKGQPQAKIEPKIHVMDNTSSFKPKEESKQGLLGPGVKDQVGFAALAASPVENKGPPKPIRKGSSTGSPNDKANLQAANLNRKGSGVGAGGPITLSPYTVMKSKSQYYTPNVNVVRNRSNSKHTQFNKKPYIIGICGGPSSGMSTVAKGIQADLQQKSGIESEILNLIDFYKPIRGNLRRVTTERKNSIILSDNQNEETTEEILKEIQTINQEIDFDDPDQIDWELLVKGLHQLKDERKPFNKPIYDKYLKVRLEQTQQVAPVPVLIVEGALIFCDPDLRNLFDLSVFIDTDDDVRLSRRVLKNEQSEAGKKIPLQELLNKYENKTKPAFEKFIEPTKKYANTIIPNYGFSTDTLELDRMAIQGVDLIITHIEQQVNIR